MRDKIAASKAKGMWMGGIPPIGYDIKDRHLIVNPDEAERVRHIFHRYLELPSVYDLSLDLRASGMAGKRWIARNGQPDCGEEWSSGSLLKLLKRKLYLGLITHKGKEYPGRHDPIIDRELFDKVQTKIAERAHSYGVRRRPNSSGRLVGIIFDDAGNRMSPIRQKKGPKHIRYYASTASIKRQHDKAGSRPRVRADRLELLVFEKLAELQVTFPDATLAKVVVDRDGFTIETAYTDPAGERRVQNHRVVCKLKLFGGVKRRLGADGKPEPSSRERDTDLLLRVARAYRWAEELESGKRASALDIAEAERLRAATVMRDLDLAWRPPRETEALLAGLQAPA